MPRLTQLRHFAEAARSGSFTAAAVVLGVTPAAISRNIALLEKQAGSLLLERNTRRMRLTAAGRAYFDRLAPALQAIADADRMLGDQREQIAGTVCIETLPYFGKHVLLPLLGEFATRYPQIEVELRFNEHGSGPPGDNADLAIRRLPPSDRSLVSRRLCELPLKVVASPDYLRRAGIPRTPEALALHDGIVARLPDGRIGSWRFLGSARGGRAESRAIEVEPRRRFLLSDQLDGVMNAALLGLGVTLMSVSPIMKQLRSGALKLLLPDYRPIGVEHYSSVYLQYSQPRYKPRRVRLLIDFLFEYFQKTDFTRFDPSYYAD